MPELMSLITNPKLATARWPLLHTGLIWIYRGAVPEIGKGMRPGRHHLSAWYFLNGSGSVEIEGRRTHARQGQWLIVKAAPRHQRFSSDSIILSIRFMAEWPDGEHLFDKGLSVTLNNQDYPALLKTASALEKQVKRARSHGLFPAFEAIDFPTHARIQQKFLNWLIAFYEALVKRGLMPNCTNIEDARLRKAIQILQHWPLETPYRETELATLLGMSSHHLESLLTPVLGATSKKYIDQRKLMFAKDRLGLGLGSIKEIAYQTGFKHTSSFCSWFRKRSGFYPSYIVKNAAHF